MNFSEKKLLWISQMAPYDGVPHAGGKIHNYLLKNFREKGNFRFFLISFIEREFRQRIDLQKYDISSEIVLIDKTRNFQRILKKAFSALFGLTVLLGFGSIWYIKKIYGAARRYKKENGNPDVVVLQWTVAVNQILWLKRMFPCAQFVCIEEDVSFLKKARILKNANIFLHFVKYPFFLMYKKNELHSLELSDLVVLNNEKDRKLIEKEGVDLSKIFVCHPFFQNMQHISNRCCNKDILFYGAMNRPENYLSAIWFLDNVFIPCLEKKGFNFIVVGNQPHEMLKKYDNGNSVRIVGFVENVSPYFENSLCLVAPLVMGAGVKIKIIETMSAGMPVLTNEIGIEGIFAEDGKEFFLCKTPEDYEKNIMNIANDAVLRKKIAINAKRFIECNYNYEKDAGMLYRKIYTLAGLK